MLNLEEKFKKNFFKLQRQVSIDFRQEVFLKHIKWNMEHGTFHNNYFMYYVMYLSLFACPIKMKQFRSNVLHTWLTSALNWFHLMWRLSSFNNFLPVGSKNFACTQMYDFVGRKMYKNISTSIVSMKKGNRIWLNSLEIFLCWVLLTAKR